MVFGASTGYMQNPPSPAINPTLPAHLWLSAAVIGKSHLWGWEGVQTADQCFSNDDCNHLIPGPRVTNSAGAKYADVH